MAYVTHDGKVEWFISLSIIRTSCEMLVYKFPFDEQECNIELDATYNRVSEVKLQTMNASDRADNTPTIK